MLYNTKSMQQLCEIRSRYSGLLGCKWHHEPKSVYWKGGQAEWGKLRRNMSYWSYPVAGISASLQQASAPSILIPSGHESSSREKI
jgi:hypothetical protein